MLETSTGWRPAQKDKQFYGIHFLTSFFSAISQHCLVPWVSFFQSISQMSLTSVTESHLGSKWQEARDRKWRKKKKEGRGGLVPPLITAAPLSPCSEVWLLQFSTGAALLPLLPPQNCLGPGVKVNGEKGEGKQKSDFLNLWVLGVLFCSSRQN